MRIAILDSHPIQYHVPWFRELSQRCELTVLFAHQQSGEGQARAGYGVAFDWDVDLASGYESRYLQNVASDPGVHHFRGCDTPEIASVIREGRFDAVIVTGWYLKAFWQAVRACRRAGVPVLVRGDSQLATPRNPAVQLAKGLVYPLLLRSFDGFLSVGSRNRAYLTRFGVPASRIFTVPHVVDTERFAAAATAEARACVRARIGAGEGDRIALQVGRLVAFKRPMDLLEAIARAAESAKQRDMPQTGSWIAAFAGAGPLSAEIEQLAHELNVRVHLFGFVNQSELPQIYAAADVLVLASDGSETWGLVVNEAMAAGVPAIVSDDAGCAPDMIEEGNTGYTYARGDVHALGTELGRVMRLRGQSELRGALERKTRAHSPSEAAEATLRAVESVRRARGGASP